MEIVGTVASAVTLAALFKLCIEAFDMIRAAQNQALDLKKLNLKLNIEKCRLYTWGEAMGFTSTMAEESLEALELYPHADLIQETLNFILSMFKDSQKLKDKYGCMIMENLGPMKPITGGQQMSVLQQLNASFNNFKIKPSVRTRGSSLAKKTYWVIHDRKKFEVLISEAKSLVDGLQNITKDVLSRTAQQDAMSSRIRTIPDVRTLDWVSEVCEVDYPAFSDAASLRADTISDPSNFHRDIQDWKNTVALDADNDSDASSVETAIAGLEDLTVTELKHKLSSYLLRAKDDRLRAKTSEEESQSSASSMVPEIESFREKIIEAPYPDDVTKRWGVIYEQTWQKPQDSYEAEDEDETNVNVLEEMYEASRDQDFKDELSAIEEWFKVLSSGERANTFYNLGAILSQNPNQTRFFARVQNYRTGLTAELQPSKENSDNQAMKKNNTASTKNPPPNATKPEPSKQQQSSPSTAPDHSEGKKTAPIDPSAGKRDTLAGLPSSYSDFIRSHKRMLSDSILAHEQTKMAEQIEDLKAFGQQLELRSSDAKKKSDSDLRYARKESVETLRPP